MKTPITSPAGIGVPDRMSVTYRRIGELKPDPANPRRHSNKQIRQIANSIKAFGFNVPILIDRDDNVIGGHGRLAACRELDVTEVPTLCLDHLSPEQARAFRIADNRLTEIAVWDDRLLAQQLKDLSLLGLDFSIEVTGFETGEIDSGSRHSKISPKLATIRPICCPTCQPASRSASSRISGSSATIASYAAPPSLPQPSPR